MNARHENTVNSASENGQQKIGAIMFPTASGKEHVLT